MKTYTGKSIGNAVEGRRWIGSRIRGPFSLVRKCAIAAAAILALATAPGCVSYHHDARLCGLRSAHLSAIKAKSVNLEAELTSAASLPEYRRTWPEASSRFHRWVLAIGVYQTLSWPGFNSGHSGAEAAILVVFEDRDGSIGYITSSPLTPSADPVERMLGGKAVTVQTILPPARDQNPEAYHRFSSLTAELHRISADTRPQVDEEGVWTEGVVGLNVVEISRRGEHAYVIGVNDLDWDECASTRASEQVIALWQRMVAFAARSE